MFLSGLKEAHQEVIELSDEISPQVFLAVREFIVREKKFKKIM
jgi:hypothetical protein